MPSWEPEPYSSGSTHYTYIDLKIKWWHKIPYPVLEFWRAPIGVLHPEDWKKRKENN